MNTDNIEICTKDKIFNQRGEWDHNLCSDDLHNWKVIVFCKDYSPTPGIAICTKCALLDGGWVKDKE